MKAVYNPENAYPQRFDFCFDIISYILDSGASPKTYEKLIHSCKYFFAKKNVVIVNERISFDAENSEWQLPLNRRLQLLKTNKKLWLASDFNIYSRNIKLVSEMDLLVKVYKCNLKYLSLSKQRMTFDEFILLTESKTITRFDVYNIKIENNDDTLVRLEKILECFPNLWRFCFATENPELYYFTETAEKLAGLSEFKKLKIFELSSIIPSFDCNMFCKFIEKNLHPTRKIDFSFRFHSSTPREYKEIFSKAVNTIRRTDDIVRFYLTIGF